MDWINSVFHYYNEITKANPLVATLAIPIIGGVIFYLKNMPQKIWNFLVRSTTVTLALNNTGWDGNIDAYHAFDKWFMQSGYKKYSRNFFMFRRHHDDDKHNEHYKPYRMGIGTGTHFFFYGYRFFWFSKGNLESSGSERQKEEITIRTLGWNHNVFENLIGLFNQPKQEDGTITVHTYSAAERGWVESGKIVRRDIETFCMNSEQKEDILGKIKHFIENREWYRKKGLTYKTSFLFYGPPGTGKTTLAKLLACHFVRDLYILDLTEVTNASLVNALANVRPGSFLLMEDVDEAGNAVRNREDKSDVSLAEAFSEASRLTMSGMLNAFDGALSLDNIIIMMTTNHPEKLDPAIRRKSRIDNEYLIDELTSKEIGDYLAQMYDNMSKEYSDRACQILANNQFRLPGCDVENAFKENPNNPIAFLVDINSRCLARQPLEEVN